MISDDFNAIQICLSNFRSHNFCVSSQNAKISFTFALKFQWLLLIFAFNFETFRLKKKHFPFWTMLPMIQKPFDWRMTAPAPLNKDWATPYATSESCSWLLLHNLSEKLLMHRTEEQVLDSPIYLTS